MDRPGFSRRTLLGGLAALPLLGMSELRAQPARRVIAAKIALDGARVWVGVSIQGRPPALFIIDTGAVVSMIQPSYARTLELKPRGKTRLTGIGGVQDFELHEARDIVFGGKIRQPRAVFAEPKQNLRLPRGTAGLLAAGMLTSVDTELDFDAGEWRVYPDGRGAREGFVQLPSQIRGRPGSGGSDYIFVDAVIDGRKYRLLADTGMPNQIHLFGTATRRSGLWSDSKPFVPVRAGGIGGDAERGRLVRAGRVSLGPIVFERPLIGLSQEMRHSGLADGIIGLELLELLTLSTDIRNDRLWAKRNGRSPREERYGLSGLWLEEEGGKVVVVTVAPGSPGAEAGIAVGDEVLGGTLGALILRLAGKPGREVVLETRRNGRPRSARIVLRPYL